MLRKIMKLGLIICFISFLLISCGPSTGAIEDFTVVIADGSDAAKRDGAGDNVEYESSYLSPKGVRIAFTKVWFPAGNTYFSLLNSEYAVLPGTSTTHSGGVSSLKDGFDAVSSDGYFKAIDDVTIIDATENPARSCDVFPSHSTTYKGVLIEYSYFELDVGNYSIRYYTQDFDDDYMRKDVSIKNPENSWNNNYAYWAETITYDYTYNPDGGDLYSNSPMHNYKNIVQTYELVVEDTRPVRGYDLMPDHPVSPQEIVDARIEAGENPEAPHPADGTHIENLRNFSLAREVDWNGPLIGRYLIGGYNDEDLRNPQPFTTDPIDANTVKSYIYGININIMNSTSNRPQGLQVLSLSGHDFEKFDELVCSYPFNEKLPFPICPITGGIEVAIGWEDFDGRLNGGYYHVEEEGEGPF